MCTALRQLSTAWHLCDHEPQCSKNRCMNRSMNAVFHEPQSIRLI